MAKKQEGSSQEEVAALREQLKQALEQIEALKSKDEAPAKKVEKPTKSVVLQHKGPIRQFTVPEEKVIKAYRGTGKIDHPRFCKNVVLLPGCVVEVTPDLAEYLISTLDFQKYGLEK